MAPWLHVHVQSVQELRDWLSLNARHMDKHFGGSRVVCAHTHPLINTDMLTVPWHTCRIRCHANWYFQGRGLFWDGESYVSPLYCSLMSRFSQGLHSLTHTHTPRTRQLTYLAFPALSSSVHQPLIFESKGTESGKCFSGFLKVNIEFGHDGAPFSHSFIFDCRVLYRAVGDRRRHSGQFVSTAVETHTHSHSHSHQLPV